MEDLDRGAEGEEEVEDGTESDNCPTSASAEGTSSDYARWGKGEEWIDDGAGSATNTPITPAEDAVRGSPTGAPPVGVALALPLFELAGASDDAKEDAEREEAEDGGGLE
ncbi:hypothetical protein B0H10DRAFT_1961749 [Mycena sp. CBHHK59/15]|nr:hypothetical protein B0H10DRAFT_1961749 [Mycena sp. CBHHK59/15]